VSKIVKSQI